MVFIIQDSKHLTVSPVKSMKMNDDVLAVAVSPDGKHIAVALLDCTVKVSLFVCFSYAIMISPLYSYGGFACTQFKVRDHL